MKMTAFWGLSLPLLFLMVGLSSSMNSGLRELFKPENAELLGVMRKELDSFQVQMTSSFMEAHSRRKRAISGVTVTDLFVVSPNRFIQLVGEEVGPFSTFSFELQPYAIKRDGIYKINGLSPALFSGKDKLLSQVKTLELAGKWALPGDEMVLNGYEWEEKFFLLTSNGAFSSIYTMDGDKLTPIFRQRIFSKGNSVAGQFFEHQENLYLVLANDNAIHSTTFSAIFRWMGSYMDEIHQVQTSGATAVETFTINGKKYIAIAQSKDSTGNMELGTVVLSMDSNEHLERVQLLWSHGARDLHYMSTDKEHFLVIGQAEEPSIVYWFGGMDFIFWQQFDGLQGEGLLLNGIQLNSDEPVLVASDGGEIKFFTRSASSQTKLMTTWVQSKTFDSREPSKVATSSSSSGEKIVKVNFLQVREGEEINDFLAVTNKLLPGSTLQSTKIYRLSIVNRKLAVSRTDDSGDSLSKCLETLQQSLTDAEPFLSRIQEEGPKVLRTDKDFDFSGTLESERVVKMDPSRSSVNVAQITPELERSGPGSSSLKQSPSKLLSTIKDNNDRLELIKTSLDGIVYKSSQNKITGNLEFPGSIEVTMFEGQGLTDLTVERINDIEWAELQNSALYRNAKEPQIVTGKWSLEKLHSPVISVEHEKSKAFWEDFVLTSCPISSKQKQVIQGQQRFGKSLKFSEGLQLGKEVTINNVPVSDVVMKDWENKEIRGFKHASVVTGDFKPKNVNGRDLQQWFQSVGKIHSPHVQHFTGPLTFSKGTTAHVEQLTVDQLNSVNWDDFQSAVMLDGIAQTVGGPVLFEVLRADQLESSSISGVKSESLLSSAPAQHISSLFTVEELQLKGALSSLSINGIHLSDGVNRNVEEAQINGQVLLQDFTAEDILVPEGVLIGGKDVSKLSKLKKFHVYSTEDNSEIVLKTVKVDKLNAPVVNDKVMGDLPSKYWSKSRANEVKAPQLVLSNRAVSILNDQFQTRTLNEFKFPEEFVSLDQSEISLKVPLRFEKPVIFRKEVSVAEQATIDGIDMSKVQQMIVDDAFQGTVRGKKTFLEPVVAGNGAQFGALNGVDPKRDVVMLNSDKPQMISGEVRFQGPVETRSLSVQNGDVAVEGFANGLDLEEVRKTTAYKDEGNFIEGKVVFQKDLEAEKFSPVLLNAVNVAEITNNLLFLNHPEEEQFMEGGLEFDNAEASFLSDSLVGDINNVPVHSYLDSIVRLDSSNGLIEGLKTFQDLTLNDQLLCSTFNGVDLKELESSAFSKTKSQVVSGKWSLADVRTTSLETEEIGGMPFDNLIFSNEPFEVSSPVTFDSAGVDIKGPFQVEGHVNGIRFDENSLKEFVTLAGQNVFRDVEVNGNVEWAEDRAELERLSYLFQNAVGKSGPQTLSGKVTFQKGLESGELRSAEWLAGVNLEEIGRDALKMDDSAWELSGNNQFSRPLHLQNLVRPVTSLHTDVVNGLNLLQMNQDIYKVTDDPGKRIFEDTKALNGELHTGNLDIHGTFQDFNVNDFVLKDDPREVAHVGFKDISVSEDIQWSPEDVGQSSSGMDLASLLTNRVSLTKPQQELEGDFTFQTVSVGKEGCGIRKINDVTVKNTIRRDALAIPAITGRKIFSQSLTLDGDLETTSLNDHKVEGLLEDTLRLDRKEVISRPVIFERDVVINQPVEIESVNDLHLDGLSSELPRSLERVVKEAESPERLQSVLNSWEEHLQKMTEERPEWLEYLRLKQDLTMLGPKSRVDHVKRTELGDILVTFHHSSGENVEGVGLPKGCSCNKVSTVQIQERGNLDGRMVPQAFGEDNCLQVYNVGSEGSGRAYTVTSETFSMNATCLSEMDKTTKVFAGTELLGEMKLGHLSDVGVFSERDTDYLVLAQYFDATTKSHSTTTRIMKIDSSNNMETIQEIETHGAKKLSLGFVNNAWMLAVANSKNSLDEASCSSDSAIYVWSPGKEEFLLLRNVITDGAFDVEFITTPAGNAFYSQDFVAFAQEGNSANGEVLIFRYEQLGGNFALTQTIRSEWPISSVGKSCLGRQCFLITAVPQVGLTFYENRFVEGFQEYYNAPLFGATDVSGFTMNDEHLFAISTEKGPILAEAVIAGGGGGGSFAHALN